MDNLQLLLVRVDYKMLKRELAGTVRKTSWRGKGEVSVVTRPNEVWPKGPVGRVVQGGFQCHTAS